MREAYVSFLTNQLHEKIIEESPKGMGADAELWLPLISLDREMIRVAIEYERGHTTREALDVVVVAYLHAFREQVKKFNARKVA